MDPPYGINYRSNFQPFMNKTDHKDAADESLPNEPEMIRAFRDTWELGMHSYLSHIRDRVILCRELLNETGSIFFQISDDNLHYCRSIIKLRPTLLVRLILLKGILTLNQNHGPSLLVLYCLQLLH